MIEEMIEAIITELTSELTITDTNFNADLLRLKVLSAFDDVLGARNYPKSYTEPMIDADMINYKRNIKNIALYDYNKVGSEFESNHNENGTSRAYSSRDKLFNGIVPISRYGSLYG